MTDLRNYEYGVHTYVVLSIYSCSSRLILYGVLLVLVVLTHRFSKTM